MPHVPVPPAPQQPPRPQVLSAAMLKAQFVQLQQEAQALQQENQALDAKVVSLARIACAFLARISPDNTKVRIEAKVLDEEMADVPLLTGFLYPEGTPRERFGKDAPIAYEFSRGKKLERAELAPPGPAEPLTCEGCDRMTETPDGWVATKKGARDLFWCPDCAKGLAESATGKGNVLQGPGAVAELSAGDSPADPAAPPILTP